MKKVVALFAFGSVLSSFAAAQELPAGDPPPVFMASARTRASLLLGSQIIDPASRVIGRVSDLLVAPDGTVPFLAVRNLSGRSPERAYIVPSTWFRLSALPDGSLEFTGELSYLNAAAIPALPENNSTLLSAGRNDAIRAFWTARLSGTGNGAAGGTIADRAGRGDLLRMSSMLEFAVLLLSAWNGGIEDFMIDTVEWRVVYAAVSAPDVLGSEEALYAVPFAVLDPDPAGRRLRMSTGRTDFFLAEGFDPMNWPAEPDPYWPVPDTLR
jgi:hypothetical protein